MLGLVEFDEEDRVRAAHAHRTRRAAVHRALRPGRSTRSCMRWPIRSRCWRGRSTIRASHDLLERVRTSTGNTVIYRRGAIRAGVSRASLWRTRRWRCSSISTCRRRQHADFFNPRATYLGARGAGDEDRRAGCPCLRRRCPADVSGWFTSTCGTAATRRSRGVAQVHTAVHRRPRDGRLALPRAVAVDAPSSDIVLAGEHAGGTPSRASSEDAAVEDLGSMVDGDDRR